MYYSPGVIDIALSERYSVIYCLYGDQILAIPAMPAMHAYEESDPEVTRVDLYDEHNNDPRAIEVHDNFG